MREVYPRSLLELERQFSSEEACRAYLRALRWPKGFLCPICGSRTHWMRASELLECRRCSHLSSVMAGTLFQDSKLPLTTWFRAMWLVAGRKNGISALGLQRDLGLGSYKTAWSILHKLRRAMVRPGRDRLAGTVEVDETYWGAQESGGATGRLTYRKSLIAVAAQADGNGIGRVRLRCIADTKRQTLHGFVRESIQAGSTIITDGLNAYREMEGYVHVREVQRQQRPGVHLLPRVHRVISLLKRWMLGTHQGSISDEHLDDYLNEFTFRLNRRRSASRGKLFYRLAQHALEIEPVPYAKLIAQHLGQP